MCHDCGVQKLTRHGPERKVNYHWIFNCVTLVFKFGPLCKIGIVTGEEAQILNKNQESRFGSLF